MEVEKVLSPRVNFEGVFFINVPSTNAVQFPFRAKFCTKYKNTGVPKWVSQAEASRQNLRQVFCSLSCVQIEHSYFSPVFSCFGIIFYFDKCKIILELADIFKLPFDFPRC